MPPPPTNPARRSLRPSKSNISTDGGMDSEFAGYASTPRKRGPHTFDDASSELLRSSGVGSTSSSSSLSSHSAPAVPYSVRYSSRAAAAPSAAPSAAALAAPSTAPSTAPAPSSSSRVPLRRGWLRKNYTRMGRRVGWHERYFVCGNGALQYFKRANNVAKPRGEILLGHGCSVEFGVFTSGYVKKGQRVKT